jgi:hypothetical protein
MGNTVPPAAPVEPTENPSSGVRITGSAIKTQEELLQDAYQRGKFEALQTFDEIAAQVYEKTAQQIIQAQRDSLANSEKMVSSFLFL